jgi:hypothetical protein
MPINVLPVGKSVTGVWENSYGSIMTLSQTNAGNVWGRYSSSTGSTGVYNVVGWANPVDAGAVGQAVALGIFWRSVNGGTGDPSWHWVSGLGGQLIMQNNVRTLLLMHNMVATSGFPGLCNAGSYLDKLIYTPSTQIGPALTDVRERLLPPPNGAYLTIPSRFACVENKSLSIQLQQPNTYGGISGSLQWYTTRVENVPLVGQTDVFAKSDPGISQQAITLQAFLPSTQQAVSLSGSYNYLTRKLTVLAMLNQGTANNATYVQTAATQYTFVPG